MKGMCLSPQALSDVHTCVTRIRAAIRYHRAQISDYRCWVDDIRLYREAQLEDDTNPPLVPGEQEFMNRCAAYWELRQRESERGTGDATVSSETRPLPIDSFSDADLEDLDATRLATLLRALLDGVTAHRNVGFDKRSIADDEALYSLLPERVTWSSALPERTSFLKNCARFCGDCQRKPERLLEWSNS